MSSLYFNNAFSKQPMQSVVEAMKPYWREEFEHPLTESEGAEKARAALQESRNALAELIGARSEEIVFVSSGTEANNWALKGAAQVHQKRKNHLVISAVEHFSIYQTAQFLERQGVELTMVPVNQDGLLNPEDLRDSIRPSTFLVSIQAASDEIGTIQNLSALADLKNKFGDVLFHTDAIQYLCYEDLDLTWKPFDLVSLSSNALYGPAGIAALFVRKGTRIVPTLHGGMQEEGMRPGLQSIALVAGFGAAARLNRKNKREWKQHLGLLQQKMLEALDSIQIPLTGSLSCRTVDNVHVVADVDGEALLTLLYEEGIRASSGSTCYQYAQKESHVLKALGIPRGDARGSILFTLGIDHTIEDVQFLSDAFRKSVEHLRKIKA